MTADTKFSVLYIEDNEANRKLLEFIITKKPEIALFCAADGNSGIDNAISQKPDLILVDLTLPDISGYEVLQKLRSSPGTAAIPVVAVSGDVPSADQQFTDYSFDKYLPKPIELSPFFTMLDEFLKS